MKKKKKASSLILGENTSLRRRGINFEYKCVSDIYIASWSSDTKTNRAPESEDYIANKSSKIKHSVSFLYN